MTSKEFTDNLIAVIENNSLIEGEDDDNLLFRPVKSVRIDGRFDHRIIVETDDSVFAISVDSYRK